MRSALLGEVICKQREPFCRLSVDNETETDMTDGFTAGCRVFTSAIVGLPLARSMIQISGPRLRFPRATIPVDSRVNPPASVS